MNKKISKNFRIKMKILTPLFLVFLACSFVNCGGEEADGEHVNEIKEWHKKRIENLKKPESWLTLAGLYWLEEGKNTFGSDPSNRILFPKNAPAFIGSFSLIDGSVTALINKDIEVTCDSIRVDSVEMTNDMEGTPTKLKAGSLSWIVIKRNVDRYGIRLWDSESENLKSFEGIETFPVSKKWRIEASFKEYDPPKIINVPNVLGTIDKEESPGALHFNIDDKAFALDVLGAENRYFVIFADMTNGEETYGAGRFIYVDKADAQGRTFIDFNKAYNPPCALSKYATCPLPPKQNMLKIEIKAGEKKTH